MQLFILALSTLAFAAPEKPIQFTLLDVKGKEMGKATLTQEKKGVKVEAQLHGFTPGEHAFHFHENGKCEGPSFTSAGAHFSPDKKSHGHVENGPHEGDMPNVFITKDGTGTISYLAEAVTLKKGDNSLRKEGGTALVVHAKADDHQSQPAGDAGDRVACGVIR